MIKYNHHCDYTWCVTVYLIIYHTPGTIVIMIVGKSLEKPGAKLAA